MIKKLTAILLAGMMLATPVCAAEWGEGLSPAQPYPGVPEVDLEKTMGYVMLYPRVKMPAEHFCDTLEMYFPRDDFELKDGRLTLYDKDGEVFSTSFSNPDYVELRAITEDELEGLMWGGGMCIDIHLPVSLKLNGDYYVKMDKGCFTAAEGKVVSLPLEEKDTWIPLVSGDYGVSSLRYLVGPENNPAAADSDAEESAGSSELVTITPKTGDKVTFDVTIGGDAAAAVVYSDNGSVYFDPVEYTESGTVTGTIMQDELDWGIEFVDKDGTVLDILDMKES